MTDGRFFLIANNNARLHVYPNLQSMLTATHLGAGWSEAGEFFDIRGVRLAPVFGADWRLTGLQDTTDLPNEYLVRSRLIAVLQSLRDSIDMLLAEGNLPAPVKPEEVLAMLPDLTGRALAECHALLRPTFGDAGGPGFEAAHDGGWLHNLLCH